MTDLHERDVMVCRACGNEERASEGYPCADCGVFICLICDIRGVIYCRACQAKRAASDRRDTANIKDGRGNAN
jgi:hypothetical protein